MSIWLVIANPYAYDQAMWKAVSETQEYNCLLYTSPSPRDSR